MLSRLRHNAHVRAVARNTPGLSPLYHAINKRLILARGTARLDYAGAPLRVRADTWEIVNMRLQPVDKEPWTVAWIERNARSDAVLYDIGANIGVYSLIAAKVAPGIKVIAFEPAYATYASLCENLQLNGVADSVVPLPLVLGEASRLGSFSYRDTTAGAAMHDVDTGGGVYEQPVVIFTLDELIERVGLEPPTLMKLDVDGSEASVLAGARETLRRPQLRSLIVEIEDAQTDAVLAELEAAGFKLVDRVDERAGEPLPGVWYGTFER